MTDKQIIIDGVDVSGCEFYLPYSEKCECIVDDNGNNNLFCREYRDCYYKRMYHTGQEKDIYKNENKELYKQLKVKEQECEELKNRVAELSLFQLYKIQRDEAEKTLTEIKEIAEHCIIQDICTFCDYSDRCYIEDEEIPTYDVCKLILQKISEVVDG